MTVVTSTQNAVLTALVALATPALPGVLVVDGPYNDQSGDQVDALQRLFVGADNADPDTETVAIEADQVFQNTGTRNRTERFTVHCTATVLDQSGTGGSITTARSQASAIFAAVETFLRGTNTLPNAANINGTVQYSEIGTSQILQSYIEQGAYVEWRFDIRCTAYLQQL